MSRSTIYVSFKNYLGGFEYFPCVAYHDQGVDILETGETDVNLFENWPNSYGEFATTVTKQTFRTAKRTFVIRSQYVSRLRLEVLKYIKISPLVQILSTRYNPRTVIVDKDSFTVVKGTDKFFAIQFSVTYTDYLPSQ